MRQPAPPQAMHKCPLAHAPFCRCRTCLSLVSGHGIHKKTTAHTIMSHLLSVPQIRPTYVCTTPRVTPTHTRCSLCSQTLQDDGEDAARRDATHTRMGERGRGEWDDGRVACTHIHTCMCEMKTWYNMRARDRSWVERTAPVADAHFTE